MWAVVVFGWVGVGVVGVLDWVVGGLLVEGFGGDVVFLVVVGVVEVVGGCVGVRGGVEWCAEFVGVEDFVFVVGWVGVSVVGEEIVGVVVFLVESGLNHVV